MTKPIIKNTSIKNKCILVVDDEADIRRLMRGILEDEGYNVIEAENSKQAAEQFEKENPDLAILDIWLQGSEKDGLEILESFKRARPFFPVLMISGHGNIETAVHAIKNGAYDFIEKPFKSDRLLLMIARALEKADLQKENDALKNQGNLIVYCFMMILSSMTEQTKNIPDDVDNIQDTTLREARESFERKYLIAQIERFEGNISKTANFVGMERAALHRKLKSLDISLNDAQTNKMATKRHTA